jgi:uncharacterized protein YegP (UPF0339 family)
MSRPDKTVVFQDKAGQWRWRRVAGNGETIATSGESYTRLADAERAASRAFMAPHGPDDEEGDDA